MTQAGGESGFEIGDTVEWESQSGGKIRRKVGTIIKIVPADTVQHMGIDFPEDLLCMFDGMSRIHESYLVQVGRKIYWPRVKWLKKT